MSTMPGIIRRLVGISIATTAAFTGTGCGDGIPNPAGYWVAPTATPKSAAVRVKKITSACELLPATAVVEVLGDSAGTGLTSREQPVQDTDREPEYGCVYGRDGREALALTATVLPDRADAAEQTIEAVARASKVDTTPVRKVGAAAVSYVTEDEVRVITFVVPYEDELRLVAITGPEVVPQEKFTELAKLVSRKI
ncbi:MAG TPA: hypothetical protein VGD43_14410 [Micromonospora sp.]